MVRLSGWKGFHRLNRGMFDSLSLASDLLPFPQSDTYAAAARACGATVRRVDLGCGQALVLERPGRRLVLRGPLWDPGSDAAARRLALRRLARWPGLTIATPESDLRGFGLVPLVTPVHVAVWDLAGDLRAGLAGKWRNRLAAAERRGLRIGRAGGRVLDQLILAEGALRRDRGYRALPADFTRALPQTALRVFDWRHGGTIAAAMAFVVEGGTATYHLGWAEAAARDRGVHGLMLFRAAEALREEGVRWLDLGTVDSERSPGLARFKLGTGAALRRLGSTLLVLPG